MIGHERLELGDGLPVAAELELSRDPLLHRLQPDLLEARDVALERRFAGEVGERRAPPQLERLGERFEGRARVVRQPRRLPHERLEPQDVELSRIRADEVAGRPSLDPVRAHGAPEPRYVRLQRAPCRLRGFLAPQGVDQVLGGDDLVRAKQQVGEDEPLLGSAERDRAAPFGDLERPEDAVPHLRKVPPVRLPGKPRSAPGSGIHCRTMTRPPCSPLAPRNAASGVQAAQVERKPFAACAHEPGSTVGACARHGGSERW